MQAWAMRSQQAVECIVFSRAWSTQCAFTGQASCALPTLCRANPWRQTLHACPLPCSNQHNQDTHNFTGGTGSSISSGGQRQEQWQQRRQQQRRLSLSNQQPSAVATQPHSSVAMIFRHTRPSPTLFSNTTLACYISPHISCRAAPHRTPSAPPPSQHAGIQRVILCCMRMERIRHAQGSAHGTLRHATPSCCTAADAVAMWRRRLGDAFAMWRRRLGEARLCLCPSSWPHVQGLRHQLQDPAMVLAVGGEAGQRPLQQ